MLGPKEAQTTAAIAKITPKKSTPIEMKHTAVVSGVWGTSESNKKFATEIQGPSAVQTSERVFPQLSAQLPVTQLPTQPPVTQLPTQLPATQLSAQLPVTQLPAQLPVTQLPTEGADVELISTPGSVKPVEEEGWQCGTCGHQYMEETDEEETWIECDVCKIWYHLSDMIPGFYALPVCTNRGLFKSPCFHLYNRKGINKRFDNPILGHLIIKHVKSPPPVLPICPKRGGWGLLLISALL